MSALSKLKSNIKNTKTQKPKRKEKPMAKHKEEEYEEVEVPSVDEINKMKAGDLDEFHEMLTESTGEEIEGWDDMKIKQKRAALVEALHDFEESEEEVDEEASEEDEKVVPLKKEKGKKASKKEKSEEKPAKKKAKTETEPEQTEAPAKKEKAKKTKGKKVSKESNADPIDLAVHDIENLSEEEAYTEVNNLSENIEYNYFRLGGVLSVIDSKKYYGEYANFREVVEAEFSLQYRKARYLVDIYNNIVTSGVSWEKLKHIGWTKLREISHLITEDNIDEWIEKCETMNTDTLKAEVKNLTRDDTEDHGSQKATSNTTTMSFKLHDDQKENVDAAIEQAMEAIGTDVRSAALEAICLDYLSGDTKKTKARDMTPKEFFKKMLKDSDGDIEEALDKILGNDFDSVFPNVELSVTLSEAEEDEEDEEEDDDTADEDEEEESDDEAEEDEEESDDDEDEDDDDSDDWDEDEEESDD